MYSKLLFRQVVSVSHILLVRLHT